MTMMKIILISAAAVVAFIIFLSIISFSFLPKVQAYFTDEQHPEMSWQDWLQADMQSSNIIEDQRSKIIWHKEYGEKTDLVVVYIHGFSASNRELSPFPEEMATGLQANLVAARLTGHSLKSNGLVNVKAEDWLRDTAQAISVGRQIGHRLILVGSSTGATAILSYLHFSKSAEDIAGLLFVSPNVGLRSKFEWVFDLPFSRYLVPMILGKQRSFQPENENHASRWTATYPTAVLVEVARMVRTSLKLDVQSQKTPVFLITSPKDKVTNSQKTFELFGKWEGDVSGFIAFDRHDKSNHTLVGNTLAPDATKYSVPVVVNWAKRLQ